MDKITKCSICNTVLFFTLGEDNDEVLVTLSLIEQVIKDASSIYVSFSVQRPQTYKRS